MSMARTSQRLDPSLQYFVEKSKLVFTISQSSPKRGLLSVTQPLHLVGTKCSQPVKPTRKRNKAYFFRI